MPSLSDPLPSESALHRLYGGATLGQRIAGGMLVVNALLVFIQMDLAPAAMQSTAFLGPGSIVSGIFDVVIGALLVGNRGRLVAWALVRIGLGLVLFTLIHVSAGDMLSAGIQLGFSGALLLLLIGRAGGVRLVIGGVMFGVYMLFAAAGLALILTGRNPIGGVMMTLRGELDGEVAGAVEGIGGAYRVQVPDTGWYRRDRAKALRDNPLADRWLVQPGRDTHLMVIDEQLPGVLAPADRLADIVVANTRGAGSHFNLISREPLPAYPEDGRLLRVQYTVQGMELEAWIGVVTAPGHGYQLFGLAPRVGFAAASNELRAMVESFRLPEGPMALPPGVEPGSVSRVVGVGAPYVLTAPGELWYLRTAEAAHVDNPSADRWLIRPDRDAHVFVSVEETEVPVQLDAVSATLQRMIQDSNSAAVLSPVQPAANGGVGFHVTAPSEQMNLEFEYRVHVVGNRTFQVVGFARTEFYAAVVDELRQLVDSFEPPAP